MSIAKDGRSVDVDAGLAALRYGHRWQRRGVAAFPMSYSSLIEIRGHMIYDKNDPSIRMSALPQHGGSGDESRAQTGKVDAPSCIRGARRSALQYNSLCQQAVLRLIGT